MAAVKTSILEKAKPNEQSNFVRTQPLTKKEWDAQLALLIPESKAAVQRLLNAGRGWHEIILPGSAKGMFVYVAPDFDEPLEDFAEYM